MEWMNECTPHWNMPDAGKAYCGVQWHENGLFGMMTEIMNIKGGFQTQTHGGWDRREEDYLTICVFLLAWLVTDWLPMKKVSLHLVMNVATGTSQTWWEVISISFTGRRFLMAWGPSVGWAPSQGHMAVACQPCKQVQTVKGSAMEALGSELGQAVSTTLRGDEDLEGHRCRGLIGLCLYFGCRIFL